MITKEQVSEIVLQNDNFYVKEHNINGVKVHSYNYFLNDYHSFETPLHKELRGLTFVEGREEPYLSIKKFWNLNENEETRYEVLKNKEIRAVLEKADGSLIQVIDINGELVTKTKMSFESPEAKLAQSVLDKDPDLQYFILDMWAKNYQPLFEIVSPENKIVLDYDETKLKLIAVRSTENGKFIPLEDITKDPIYNIDVVQMYDKTLDDCIQICKDATDLEGFVIRFHDKEQTMIKIKSLWYLERHRIVSDSDRLIEVFRSILDETLDDMLSIVSEKKREELQEINTLVVQYIDKETKRIFDIVNNSVDRKETAKKYINDEYFGVIMGSLKCPKDPECVMGKLKEYLKRKINKEQKAKEFIERLKNEETNH